MSHRSRARRPVEASRLVYSYNSAKHLPDHMCVIAALSCRNRHSRNADKPLGFVVVSAARAHDLVCGFGFRRVGHGPLRTWPDQSRREQESRSIRRVVRAQERSPAATVSGTPGSVTGGAEAPESGLARKRRAHMGGIVQHAADRGSIPICRAAPGPTAHMMQSSTHFARAQPIRADP